MSNIKLLAIFLLISFYISQSIRLSQSSTSILTGLRGGAKDLKRNAKKSYGKQLPKKVKILEEDDEEDDENDMENEDDEEEDYPVRSTNKKHGKQPLTVYKGRPVKKSRGWLPTSLSFWKSKSKKGKSKGPTIKDRLEQVAKIGQHAYKDIYRRAKVLRSSTFEGNLLKATWPGDNPVPSELLSEIIKYSIPAFKYTRSDGDEDDPYVMTLHKLWMKMTEKDWRTIMKSLYILHCISRDSSIDACNRFAETMKDMSKTRNAKKPDQRYFDMKLLGSQLVDTASNEGYVALLKDYGKFVISRAKLFRGHFHELQQIDNESESEKKKVIVLLNKAKTLLQQGLKVEVNKTQLNVITADMIRLMIKDLRELWNIYVTKLALLITSSSPTVPLPPSDDEHVATTAATSTNTAQEDESIQTLVSFASTYSTALNTHITKMNKLFKPLNIKLIEPTGSTTNSNKKGGSSKRGGGRKGVADDSGEVKGLSQLIAIDNVQEKYKHLLTISGGARLPSVKKVTQAIDEEEEDDDEEEEDEDELEGEAEDEEEEGDEDEDDDVSEEKEQEEDDDQEEEEKAEEEDEDNNSTEEEEDDDDDDEEEEENADEDEDNNSDDEEEDRDDEEEEGEADSDDDE